MRLCSQFWLSVIFCFALSGFVTPIHAAAIGDYHPVFLPGQDQAGRSLIAIRSYTADGSPKFLAVDPVTLTTESLDAACFIPRQDKGARLADSPYFRTLQRYTSLSHFLQNDGARRADRPANGFYLTVDLCPSRAPFEKGLFEAVGRLSQISEGAAPVAVAISGLWLEKHHADFDWLVNEEKVGRLAITWVNHSWDHPYHPGEPLERNFLLASGTDFDQEVLWVEQALLSRGTMPSVFFRFPGLVSDERLVKRLRELSLIPIGSDAWLAKGEAPKDGSFILVHGNGNEPKGVRLFIEMLKAKPVSLLELRKAFGQEKNRSQL